MPPMEDNPDCFLLVSGKSFMDLVISLSIWVRYGWGNLWGPALSVCCVSFRDVLNQAESLTAHSPWQRHGYMNVGEYVLKGQKHYESIIYAYTFCLYICFCAYSAPMPLITFTRDVVLSYELLGLSARLSDTNNSLYFCATMTFVLLNLLWISIYYGFSFQTTIKTFCIPQN